MNPHYCWGVTQNSPDSTQSPGTYFWDNILSHTLHGAEQWMRPLPSVLTKTTD